jgi:putative methyltransferase (TIGR04325 family)
MKLGDLVPPVVARGIGWLKTSGRGRIRFTGPYRSWEEATRLSGGYDDREILRTIRTAALKVKRGEAAFERDGVIFRERAYDFPLLSAMLRSALIFGGELSVLDFGGSLGSTYHQCRPFLDGVRRVRWSVVEQESYVKCGREEFETGELRFFGSIGECLKSESPRLALFSAVLQYVPDPDAIVHEVTRAGLETIVVDRTAVDPKRESRIMVQHVPPSIYRASYPFRVFGRSRFLQMFGGRYVLVAEFPSLSFDALEQTCGVAYQGCILRRADAPGRDC